MVNIIVKIHYGKHKKKLIRLKKAIGNKDNTHNSKIFEVVRQRVKSF